MSEPERFSAHWDRFIARRRFYPLGRLQAWLQGYPNKDRPWPVARAGNFLSDVRWWAWRLDPLAQRRERRILSDPDVQAALRTTMAEIDEWERSP